MTPPASNMMMRWCPLLLVLSGPSGVGKTTITQELAARGWRGHIVVTATTRRPRPGEVDGVHYHFNWYGVPATPVRAHLAAGIDVILTIDPQGAKTIRERTRGAVSVFLIPESLDELVQRMNQRASDTAEQRALRLLNAEREMAELPSYEYVIVNREGRLDEAVMQLEAIMTAEHCRVRPRCPEV
jgi:guanylate kinase